MLSGQDSKVFHIGDVLSVTTSHLVSPRYMDGVYDLVRYLTEREPELDNLAEAMGVCKRYLIQLHPQFEDLNIDGVEFENWRSWLQGQQAIHGEWIAVRRPLPGEVA